jgi:hypothetical protein
MTIGKIVGVIALSALAVAPAGCGKSTRTAKDTSATVGTGTAYSVGKGTLIGTGAGAVGGAIYDITRIN